MNLLRSAYRALNPSRGGRVRRSLGYFRSFSAACSRTDRSAWLASFGLASSSSRPTMASRLDWDRPNLAPLPGTSTQRSELRIVPICLWTPELLHQLLLQLLHELLIAQGRMVNHAIGPEVDRSIWNRGRRIRYPG